MRTKLSIFLIIFLTFTASVYSAESDYHTSRIPTDTINPEFITSLYTPRINDSGNVVFTAFPQIYFWDKNQVSTPYIPPQRGIGSDLGININNNNEIVWSERGLIMSPSRIYLNGTPISPDNHQGFTPSINNNGEVVWEDVSNSTSNSTSNIYFWDKTTITTITSGGNLYLPVINDNSHIVWSSNNNLFLWNGSAISQITNNTNPNLSIMDIAFNNNGDIAYSYDNNELYFYDGATTLITNTCLYPFFGMNDSGEIVWSDLDDIFIYKNGAISEVTDDELQNKYPDINNNGEIVYVQHDPTAYDTRILIATPIPEPSVVLLFFLGSLFLYRKKR